MGYTEENNSGGAWYADGETEESTRTPFDDDTDFAAPPSPVLPAPPQRRRGQTVEPDLFANRPEDAKE